MFACSCVHACAHVPWIEDPRWRLHNAEGTGNPRAEGSPTRIETSKQAIKAPFMKPTSGPQTQTVITSVGLQVLLQISFLKRHLLLGVPTMKFYVLCMGRCRDSLTTQMTNVLERILLVLSLVPQEGSSTLPHESMSFRPDDAKRFGLRPATWLRGQTTNTSGPQVGSKLVLGSR